jgi:hypothetical protein
MGSRAGWRRPLAAATPGYRFPAEIISHAAWLYYRFSLSLRMVEEMLAARGISVGARRSDPPPVWWTPMLSFRARRKVSDERHAPGISGTFKREAVDRVATSGLPVGRVAGELGLNETVLRRWVAPARG